MSTKIKIPQMTQQKWKWKQKFGDKVIIINFNYTMLRYVELWVPFWSNQNTKL